VFILQAVKNAASSSEVYLRRTYCCSSPHSNASA